MTGQCVTNTEKYQSRKSEIEKQTKMAKVVEILLQS